MSNQNEITVSLDSQQIKYLGTIKGEFESLEDALARLVKDSLERMQDRDFQSLG